MASFAPELLLLALLLWCCSGASSFNITEILNQTPGFGVFNSYLTQTLVAGEINSRQTITVLAVPDSAMSALSGKPPDVTRRVLGLHVVLDYYDMTKFRSLNNGTALLVTLFQASGMASGAMGFLNAIDLPSGVVALGSAVPGAALDSQLVQSLFAEPYNISVLQVSSVIIPPGIDGTAPPPPPASNTSPPPVRSPKLKHGAAAPAPAAPLTVTRAPAPSTQTPAPTTATTPGPSPASPEPVEAPASQPPPSTAGYPRLLTPPTPAAASLASQSAPPPASPGPSASSSGAPSGRSVAIGTAATAAAAMGAALLIAF